MPRIDLYVKEADVRLWNQARRLAARQDRSLSDVVSEALREHVTKAGADVVELETGDGERIRIRGRLLAQTDRERVYRTVSERIVVWVIASSKYRVYDSIAEAELRPEVRRAAEAALGTVHEID